MAKTLKDPNWLVEMHSPLLLMHLRKIAVGKVKNPRKYAQMVVKEFENNAKTTSWRP
jgi:hypothetical protein